MGLTLDDVHGLADAAKEYLRELNKMSSQEIIKQFNIKVDTSDVRMVNASATIVIVAIRDAFYPVMVFSAERNVGSLARDVMTAPLIATLSAALGTLGVAGQIASGIVEVADFLSLMQKTAGIMVFDGEEEGYSIACNADADCIGFTPQGMIDFSGLDMQTLKEQVPQ